MQSKIARLYLAVFLSTILLILAIGFASIGQVHFGDIPIYYGQASSIFHGRAPYGGTKIEYLPGVVPFMLLPYLLTFLTHSYYASYLLLTWLVVAILIWYVISSDNKRWWVFIVPLIPILQFAFMQLDIYSAFFLYFCIASFKKKNFLLSATLLAFATIIKAYPAVCLLPLIWMVPPKQRFRYFGVFSGLIALMLLPVLILEPKGLLYAITYQTDRPVEIMASSSIVGYILKIFSGKAHYVVSHKSYGIVFPFEKFVEWFTSGCLALGLLALSYAKRLNRLGDMPAILSIAALLIYILFYNVGSPQFLICVVVLLPLALDEIEPQKFEQLTFVLGLSCLVIWLQFLFKFIDWLALCLLSLRILLLSASILLCIRLAMRNLKTTKKLRYNNAHG